MDNDCCLDDHRDGDGEFVQDKNTSHGEPCFVLVETLIWNSQVAWLGGRQLHKAAVAIHVDNQENDFPCCRQPTASDVHGEFEAKNPLENISEARCTEPPDEQSEESRLRRAISVGRQTTFPGFQEVFEMSDEFSL